MTLAGVLHDLGVLAGLAAALLLLWATLIATGVT